MNNRKGISLLEVVIALAVLGMVSVFFIKYSIDDAKRTSLKELASFLYAIDKGFYDATVVARKLSIYRNTYCGSYPCLEAGNSNSSDLIGFVRDFIQTSRWTTNTSVPQNLLDPRVVPERILGSYYLIVWLQQDSNNANDYRAYEIEVRKQGNKGFNNDEINLLFQYLKGRICIDGNGYLHYFLNGTVVNATVDNPSCQSGIVSNYYVITRNQQ